MQKSFLTKLKTQILSRKQPFTTFNWRFLLPGGNQAIKIHRYVFLSAFKEYPLILRALVMSYNLTSWWLCFGWLSIYKAYKGGHKTCSEKYGIKKSKQLLSLFRIAFGYCIIPIEYYKLRLHRWPASEWLKFAYDFQSNSFHGAFIKKHDKFTADLLNNKHDFETFLADKSLPTLKSSLFIKASDEITQAQLENLPVQSFFKPNIGNRGVGCFTLMKDLNNKFDANLSMQWFKDGSISPYKDRDDLNRLIRGRDYLVQPIYKNHIDFIDLFEIEKVATLRVITAKHHDQYRCVFAVLETAQPDKPIYYWNIALDTDSGAFIKPQKNDLKELQRLADFYTKIENKSCPHWDEIKSICVQAHQQIPQLVTIGWDMALTQQGVMIVEGNISWGLNQYQIVTQKPIIDTQLGTIYIDEINSN